MCKKYICLMAALVLYFNGVNNFEIYGETKDTASESVGIVAVSSNTSEGGKKRTVEKKYIRDVERGEKRYVGDVDKVEVENSRRRGTEKRYMGQKEEDEFFRNQKDSTFKYDYKAAKNPEDQMNDARVKWKEESVDEELFELEEAKEQAEGIIPPNAKGERADIPEVKVFKD